MTYACPKNMDGFLSQLRNPDRRFSQQLGTDLLAFLANPKNLDGFQDFGRFVDGLRPWLKSNNYKISSNGIDVLTYLIDRLGPDFKTYVPWFFPDVVDRLGDPNISVREKSQLLLQKLLEKNVVEPRPLLERLRPACEHKNPRVRVEVLRCIATMLDLYNIHYYIMSKTIPTLLKLVSDTCPTVRAYARDVIVKQYKHVGQPLRDDLEKRNISKSTWTALSARFDEVQASGTMAATSRPAKLNKKYKVANGTTSTAGKRLRPSLSLNSVFIRNVPSTSKSTFDAVEQYVFIKHFKNCPTVQIHSTRQVTGQMKKILQTISNRREDWNERVDALKMIRSLVVAGAVNYEKFLIGIRNLEIPLQGTLKDPRSQVVREACITIAYLSQSLGNKFDITAEMLLQHLINLIPNSRKVIATSVMNTLWFIIKKTQSSRLIPIITRNIVRSRSKNIRKACCEVQEYILKEWNRHCIQRHWRVVQEAIKTGIEDSDPEARLFSRGAYKCFCAMFPEHADRLLQSVNIKYRSTLHCEGLSAASSRNDISIELNIPTIKDGRLTVPSNIVRRSRSATDLRTARWV